MAANVDGPFLVTRAVLPGMKARRRGKIVNICSLASDLGRPNIVPYAVSKGGAQEVHARARGGARAARHPGQRHRARLLRDADEAPLVADAEFSAWVRGARRPGRWGDPHEIAGAAVFLASPAADYVTGHLLTSTAASRRRIETRAARSGRR